ncbi:MAG: 4-hydroxythreonine-4-phosphate dehydrogenase PdxA [Hydrogenophaga sp.]|nr:4-hydroxythreonine-4-phosphate dehydrogenase PdxA [Hydrogenophaga sp.]
MSSSIQPFPSRSAAVPSGTRPLAITMGDPAGIGPEIIARAFLSHPEWAGQLVVLGDVATLRRAVRLVEAHDGLKVSFPVVHVSSVGDWSHAPPRCLPVVQACTLPVEVIFGQVSAEAGRAAAECIRLGALAALDGAVRALVTAPVHKEALAAAGLGFPGHTEYLQALAAERCGKSPTDLPVRMMLSCPGLRTVLVSIHVALRRALECVTPEQLDETLELTHAHFLRMGVKAPSIAVAGLNPHAGEGGLFGREELDVIAPAIERARQRGMVNVSGPHAPDTVFMRARQGAFDVVVAMYHDQGLIPVKLLGLDHGVNTTIGLPFIRTSPDHGTAMDLAGTARASEASLVAAIEAAMASSSE